MIRRTVHFSGRVQGVGFRATIVEAVAGTSVVGTVRNLPDGRVVAVFEGTPGDVESIVRDVRARMMANLTDVDSRESAATGEFRRFEIVR